MPACFFAADLHGRVSRYQRLAERIEAERPAAVFLGGDLLPHGVGEPFLAEFVQPLFLRLSARLGDGAPRVFLIFGNDDPRSAEEQARAAEDKGAWTYVHGRHCAWAGFDVYGYAFVPPTPFLLKDWERFDVSRHVEPACVSPEEGRRTVAVEDHVVKYATIADDLEALAGAADLARAIVLFHAPPHATALDRAALDGRVHEHVPLDVHVGSMAIRRFIERRRPRVTLHGHIHESARLTGTWLEQIGATVAMSAAHDGPELALVRFDPEAPGLATRELLT